MLQVLFYSAVGLAGTALTLLLWNRKKSYHGFMIRQCNLRDDAYDQIYSNI